MRRLLLVILLFSCPALASDYYISTTGSDANSCTNATTNACATFQRCLLVMSAGDTCYARGGTYTIASDAWIVTNNGGTAGSPKTFRSYPGETAVLDPPSTQAYASYVAWRLQSTDYITISDLTINGALWFDVVNGGDGRSVGVTITRVRFGCPGFLTYNPPWAEGATGNASNLYLPDSCSNMTCSNDGWIIRDNYFEVGASCPLDGTSGYFDWLHLYKTTNLLVEQNDFVNLSSSINIYRGIYVKGSNQGAVVRWNYVKGSGNNILWGSAHSNSNGSSSAGGNKIYQNIFSGASGIEFTNQSSLNDKWFNNTVYQPTYDAIKSDLDTSASGAEVFNNIVYGNPSVGAGYAYVGWDSPLADGICDQSSFDYNLYYPVDRAGTDFRNIGTNYNTFGNWQSGLSVCPAPVDESSSTLGDPLFVNPSSADFHLQAGSPALSGGRGSPYWTVRGAYVTGVERIGCSTVSSCSRYSSTASAITDFYVRTTGSDTVCNGRGNAANPGGSCSSTEPCECAWATLEKCATTLTAGQRCLIQSGTYYEDNFTQANSGTLESTSLLSDCSCTKGSATISCSTPIPGTVNVGDFVMCQIPGQTYTGWAWTQVSGVSGSTISLVEGYKGQSVSSTGTLDVANMIQFVGAGSLPTDVTLTHWANEPVDVSWTLEAGTSCTYSYTFSSTSDALWSNTAPKGFRDSAPSYAQWRTDLQPNGKDAYIKLEGDYGDCPCGDNRTIAQNVDAVPGSWASDATKVYLHVRGTDVDGDGTWSGSCVDPDGVAIQRARYDGLTSPMFTADKSYTIIDNMTFEAGISPTAGDAKVLSRALLGPGQVSWLMSNVRVNSGTVRTSLASSVNMVRYEHSDFLNGWETAAGNFLNSDLSFYDLEVRGNAGNLITWDGLRGNGTSDRVLFERIWAHNNWTSIVGNGDGVGGNCNGQPATWSCTNRQYSSEFNRYKGNHCVWFGSSSDNTQIFTNIMFRNSVIEMCADGFAYYAGDAGTTPSTDLWVVNNTLGTQPGVWNEHLKIAGGATGGTTAYINAYNNVTMCAEIAKSGCSGDGNFNWYGSTQPFIANYNAYINSSITSISASPRIWKSGETFDFVRGSYAQESSAILVCGSACTTSGSPPGAVIYNDGAGVHRFTDINPSDGDGTDYTPLGASRIINAGTATYCPTEDFYGNARTDGQCDMGAIEYLGANLGRVKGVRLTGAVLK